jgi:hypothetical protein
MLKPRRKAEKTRRVCTKVNVCLMNSAEPMQMEVDSGESKEKKESSGDFTFYFVLI